ncbi:peptidyl-prolyl cis-trans isomerase SurA [Actinocorallia herbida]|uniref:Peptidyl-prolyl cis-trans isomerase SurA n=1 Tax=Actinocorallia herbida TaxID=58109 RepID=A0A3N1CPW0_9ACTN|nr:SurA N-terminal domain-containing protein [Actinocorallia herbida]ROO82758.1 peptidyl-prolyl cis-trans isomerase SurA [Actinocorallia herbida]
MTLAVVALALSATACGGQVRMGAAATFADEPRISQADLGTAAEEWQTYYAKHPLDRSILLLPKADSLQGSILAGLIGMRVADQTAEDRGIEVTDAQVDQFIAQLTGGQTARFDQVAMRFGVAPSHSRRFARMLLITDRLSQGAADEDAAVRQVGDAFAASARGMGIKVNPRYGDAYASGVSLGMLYPPVQHLSLPATGTGR